MKGKEGGRQGGREGGRAGMEGRWMRAQETLSDRDKPQRPDRYYYSLVSSLPTVMEATVRRSAYQEGVLEVLEEDIALGHDVLHFVPLDDGLLL